jgi:hypothetical protein
MMMVTCHEEMANRNGFRPEVIVFKKHWDHDWPKVRKAFGFVMLRCLITTLS